MEKDLLIEEMKRMGITEEQVMSAIRYDNKKERKLRGRMPITKFKNIKDVNDGMIINIVNCFGKVDTEFFKMFDEAYKEKEEIKNYQAFCDEVSLVERKNGKFVIDNNKRKEMIGLTKIHEYDFDNGLAIAHCFSKYRYSKGKNNFLLSAFKDNMKYISDEVETFSQYKKIYIPLEMTKNNHKAIDDYVRELFAESDIQIHYIVIGDE